MGTKLRVAFVLMFLCLPIAGLRQNHARALEDDGRVGAAWTIIDAGGNWGDFLRNDTPSYPGVRCWNHGTAVDITLDAPWPYANSSYLYQPVDLYFDVYRVNSSTSVTKVRTSTTFRLTAYY